MKIATGHQSCWWTPSSAKPGYSWPPGYSCKPEWLPTIQSTQKQQSTKGWVQQNAMKQFPLLFFFWRLVNCAWNSLLQAIEQVPISIVDFHVWCCLKAKWVNVFWHENQITAPLHIAERTKLTQIQPRLWLHLALMAQVEVEHGRCLCCWAHRPSLPFSQQKMCTGEIFAWGDRVLNFCWEIILFWL